MTHRPDVIDGIAIVNDDDEWIDEWMAANARTGSDARQLSEVRRDEHRQKVSDHACGR